MDEDARRRRGAIAFDAGVCVLLAVATGATDEAWLSPRGRALECGEPLPDLLSRALACLGARPSCEEASPLLDLAVVVPCALTACREDSLAFFLSRLKYVLFLRLLIMVCTALPPPGAPAQFDTYIQGSLYQVGCSGHAALVLLAGIALATPSSVPAWLGYAALVSLGIIASRCHYSLCIFTAWLLVLAVCPLATWPLAA